MLAIYYVENSGPYHMVVLEVSSTSVDDFKAAMKKQDAPWPNSDVVFIKDNQVVVQKFIEK